MNNSCLTELKKIIFNLTLSSWVSTETAYFIISIDLSQIPTSERILHSKISFIAFRLSPEHAPFYSLPSDMAYTSIIHIPPFARSGELNLNTIKSWRNKYFQWLIAEVMQWVKSRCKKVKANFTYVFVRLFVQNSRETKCEQNTK